MISSNRKTTARKTSVLLAVATLAILANCGRADGGFAAKQGDAFSILDGSGDDPSQAQNQPQQETSVQEPIDPEENELLNQLRPDYAQTPGATATPSVTATPSPTPIQQGSQPVPTPQPTIAPAPSATPVQPTATATPIQVPPQTPSQTPTPTPTPRATVTPNPVQPRPTATPAQSPHVMPTPIPRPPVKPAPKPSATPKPPPALVIPIRGFWEGRADGAVDWTKYTVTALNTYGTDLIGSTPSDIQDFCPNYSNLSDRGRVDFWVKLVSAIAMPESDYNPSASYAENFKDKNGNAVISRGLLQLSLTDAGGYNCPFANDNDLNSPKLNLECGVMILDRLISQYGVISGYDTNSGQWLGASRYWGTLRTYNNKFAILKKLVRQSATCKLN